MRSRILTFIGVFIAGVLFFALTNRHSHLIHAPYSCIHAGVDSTIQLLFPSIPYPEYEDRFSEQICYWTEGFDFPVGKPDGDGYYKALAFGQKHHLGEDWNGRGGGNTDLGDPVFSSANGLVIFAQEVCCGWGKVIRIAHYLPEQDDSPYIETIYGHLEQLHVQTGDWVKRGQTIGTIGTANGQYSAHLHFELRDFIAMSLGPGYGIDRYGYRNPTKFIETNRPEDVVLALPCTSF